MKRTLSLMAGIIILLTSGCKEDTKFKKAKGGLEYAIYKGDGGAKIAYGNLMQFKATGYYDDSLLATPFDSVVQLVQIDSMQLPPDLVQAFTEAKVGDSIVTRLLVDSAKKYGPLPDYAQAGKGKYLGFRIKLYGVITDTSKAEAEKMKLSMTMRRIDSIARIQLLAKEDKVIADKIAKDGGTPVKTAKGTYVVITNPGEGTAVDSGKTVTVDYKGMTFNGQVFDQSYDESGASTKPYTFTIGQRGAIEGWDDGLRVFKKGGKGKLYIPSILAYGQRGNPPAIKPNEPLMFEVEVKAVMNAQEAANMMKKQQEEMMKLQQQAAKDTARKR